MLCRVITIGLLVLLPGVLLAAEDKLLDLKVIYYGEPGSERAKDYCSFLARHFRKVVEKDYSKYDFEQSKEGDVLVFDWSDVYDGKGNMDQEKWKAAKAPQLGGMTRPAILVGHAGGSIVTQMFLNIDWLCLCLAGPAHHVAVDHPIFHAPLDVNPEFTEQPTPADYPELTIDPSLGPTMKVWKVQNKNYPDVDPGLVSTLYGFADSPDAEVFAQGCAGKGPDTVALARHANFFLWGFSAQPSDMTPAAQRLFVNAIVYMRQFDGQRPIVGRAGAISARESALRYAIIPRQLSEESEKRTAEELREMVAKHKDALPEEARDDPEAFIAERVKAFHDATLDHMKSVTPEPLFEKYGLDADKYLAYYRENLEYLRPDEQKWGRFMVDEDAKTVGPSNRSPELLERCVVMLERNDRPEMAKRLLKRYTEQSYQTAAQWRGWLDIYRSQLFFSDLGGYKFFVGPAAQPASKRIQAGGKPAGGAKKL